MDFLNVECNVFTSYRLKMLICFNAYLKAVGFERRLLFEKELLLLVKNNRGQFYCQLDKLSNRLRHYFWLIISNELLHYMNFGWLYRKPLRRRELLCNGYLMMIIVDWVNYWVVRALYLSCPAVSQRCNCTLSPLIGFGIILTANVMWNWWYRLENYTPTVGA